MSLAVLHITDLHILPTPGATIYGSDTFEALRGVLAAALALPAPPALIVATGDLAEDGSAASYRRLRALLVGTGLPTLVVPGNHDAPETLARELLCDAVQPGPIVDHGGWRLILLDSRVDGASHGHLSPAQLAACDQALAAEPARPALLALHHGPAVYCPSHGCQLENRGALRALLDAHRNARGVIAGHGHVDVDEVVGDARLFVTPSTCSQCEHAPGGEGVDHDDFWASHRFDPSRRGFRMLTLHDDGRLDGQLHWI